jgi:hypothetical protein
MGRQALQICWQPVFADLAARSMPANAQAYEVKAFGEGP